MLKDPNTFLRGRSQVMSMTDRRALRNEYREWLISLQPNYVVCPAFHRPETLQNAERKIKNLFNMLQGFVLGRDWAKKPAETRLWAVGFYEAIKTDLHCHIAVRTPDGWGKALHEYAPQAWRKLVPCGTLKADDIHDLRGAVDYLTKEQTALGRLDNTFLYVPNTSLGGLSKN